MSSASATVASWPEPDQEALESLDDLLQKRRSQGSLGDRSSSSLTITPDSPVRAAEIRDESRWNGFHLWRTESYNLRAARERAAAEAQRLAARRFWFRITTQRAKRWLKVSYNYVKGKSIQDGTDKGEHASWVRMLLLTLVMAGAQLAWCLEFGYGTPYLLSLGLSKASTSLVWIAAPVSGLIMQPLIGVLSDLSVSRFRRRQYILIALVVLVISTLVLAFSTPISSALVDIVRTGLADWDPERTRVMDDMNRFIAILAFIVLDLSINSLQAAARALILDTAPSSQHSRANAWHGRMTHMGNCAGYAAGWYDLSSTKFVAWLGGGQFRKYAVVSVIGLTTCSLITCTAVSEKARESSEGSAAIGVASRMREALHRIWQSIRRLPRPVRRICLVQLFAFMGWFPFLFYATEWIIEVRQEERNALAGHGGRTNGGGIDDEAAERGSFAMLMFAIVALIAGSLLPYLSLSNTNSKAEQSIGLRGPEGERLPEWQLAGPHQRPENGRKSWKLTLRTIWTLSLVLYSIQAAFLTFAVRSTDEAIILLASIGIPWAVASWVPFALVMESVREAEDGMSPFEFEADWFAPERVRERRESSSAFARARVKGSLRDCEPLSSSRSSVGTEQQQEAAASTTFLARGTEVVSRGSLRSPTRQASAGVPVPLMNHNDGDGSTESLGGTVLGIHNLAIVLPQFVVALLAALILQSGSKQSQHLADSPSSSKDGVSVVWVIRMGGVATIFAAILTRFVPLTRTERQMRGQGVHIAEPRYDDEVAEEEGEENDEQVDTL